MTFALREERTSVDLRIVVALSGKPAESMVETNDAEVLARWSEKGGLVEMTSGIPGEPWTKVERQPLPHIIRMWLDRGCRFRLWWDPRIIDLALPPTLSLAVRDGAPTAPAGPPVDVDISDGALARRETSPVGALVRASSYGASRKLRDRTFRDLALDLVERVQGRPPTTP